MSISPLNATNNYSNLSGTGTNSFMSSLGTSIHDRYLGRKSEKEIEQEVRAKILQEFQAQDRYIRPQIPQPFQQPIRFGGMSWNLGQRTYATNGGSPETLMQDIKNLSKTEQEMLHTEIKELLSLKLDCGEDQVSRREISELHKLEKELRPGAGTSQAVIDGIHKGVSFFTDLLPAAIGKPLDLLIKPVTATAVNIFPKTEKFKAIEKKFAEMYAPTSTRKQVVKDVATNKRRPSLNNLHFVSDQHKIERLDITSAEAEDLRTAHYYKKKNKTEAWLKRQEADHDVDTGFYYGYGLPTVDLSTEATEAEENRDKSKAYYHQVRDAAMTKFKPY